MPGGDVFGDLVAEQDRLEAILAGLGDEQWVSPSSAAGWTVRDVVLHLAQTEDAVVESVTQGTLTALEGGTVDEVMDEWVRADDASPSEVFAHWRSARRAAVTALRGADPQRRLGWVSARLKPQTLATTRLAETWAHALDIVEPLGIDLPDTGRLLHIAWLGHGSLPYAFKVAGEEPRDVFCELTGPDGDIWRLGPPDAATRISGDAGAFCRVGARRLTPEQSGLVTQGVHGPATLRALRNYAA